MNINKSSSFVWHHFDKLEADSGYATCYQCRKRYKTSGNTSNLRDHLKRVHNISNNITSPSTAQEQPGPSCPKRKRRQIQRTLEELSYNDPYKKTDPRKTALNQCLIDMVASDMQPFSIVSDRGFKRMVNMLDNRYLLPSQFVLKHNLLPQRYEEIKVKLFDVLATVNSVSLTTDCWTSTYTGDAYITVTCHFIKDFQLKSAVLETENLKGSHTAQHLADYLQKVIENWGLQNKVEAIVSDNAANIKAAIGLLKIPHMPCSAHTLNLTVNDSLKALDGIQNILTKCRSIVSRFKKSTVAMDVLKEEQTNRSEPLLKIMQDVPTRWNSTYLMLERLLKIKDSLLIAIIKLEDPPPFLSQEENKIIRDLCETLEPFYDATEQFSGDQYVSSSLIISIITGICATLKETKLQTTLGKKFHEKIIENTLLRFGQYESRIHVSRIATILDPRFKKLVFRNSSHALSATASLQTELTKIYQDIQKKKNIPIEAIEPNEPTSSTSQNEPASDENDLNDNTENLKPSPAKKKSLFKFLKKKCELKSLEIAPGSGVMLLRQYLEDANISIEEDPLEYWKNRDNVYFNVLIQKYFCCPATSVPAERVFSKSGQLICEKRSHLKAKNVNMLLFLNCNQSLLF